MEKEPDHSFHTPFYYSASRVGVTCPRYSKNAPCSTAQISASSAAILPWIM